LLEEHGVLGEANVTELNLHFIPLEHDLLSLELEDAFSDMCLRKDPTPIFASAKALMLLQKQYGLFPRILGKGDNAKRLADLLQRMRSEEDVNVSSDPSNTYLTSFGLTPSALIENLIIIDREVDFPTILATQLTYEGLIDETFGISNNQVEVDSSMMSSVPQQQQNHQQRDGTSPAPTAATKRKVQVDSSDKLYPDIRDANFATVGPLLNRTARRLASEQDNIKTTQKSVAELKSIVNTLPSHQAEKASLAIHIAIWEGTKTHTTSDIFRKMLEVEQNLLADGGGSDATAMHDNIEELIARGNVPLHTVLRLLCLESCLTNGIRQRELDSFKRHILHAYGYQHLLTLCNLEKAGLLTTRESHRGFLNPIAGTAGQTATDWNAVRRALNLWVDDVAESDPDDIAYVFSGYAPLSVRLVQCVLQKSYLQSLVSGPARNLPGAAAATSQMSGWKGFEDTLARIRGATVDVVQKGHDADAAHARQTLRGNREGPKVSLVFFLGGVTFAEVAALRLVSSRLEASGRQIIVGTTGMLSGKRAVDVAVEKKSFAG